MVRGHVWHGGMHGVGGMHGGGHAWWGVCMAGGYVWQGACMAGGVHGRRDDHCSFLLGGAQHVCTKRTSSSLYSGTILPSEQPINMEPCDMLNTGVGEPSYQILALPFLVLAFLLVFSFSTSSLWDHLLASQHGKSPCHLSVGLPGLGASSSSSEEQWWS